MIGRSAAAPSMKVFRRLHGGQGSSRLHGGHDVRGTKRRPCLDVPLVAARQSRGLAELASRFGPHVCDFCVTVEQQTMQLLGPKVHTQL